MKKIISFVLGATCLFMVCLLMGYGNRKVHPGLNGVMVSRFQEMAISVYSPLERFKNYTFVFDGSSGYTGPAVTQLGYADIEESDREKNALGWITHGGLSADEPEINASFRHFYDPTEPPGNRYLHNHLDNVESANPQIDHVEWAINHIEHAHNWEMGIAHVEMALASTDEEIRGSHLAFAYRALGETLHLIADMGCPAHVRDDSHASFTWFQFGSPDPYEEDFEELSDIETHFSDGKTDPGLRSDFSKADLASNIAIRLAEYTNQNFFTSQTISGAKVAPLIHPEKTYASPKLEQCEYDDKTYLYTKTISGNKVAMCTDYRYGIINTRGYPYIDKECVLSQGKALVPQIVEAGANVIRLFIPDLEVRITEFDENLETISGKVIHKKSAEYIREIKYSGKISIYDAKKRDKIAEVDCINGDYKEEIDLKDFKNVDWRDYGIWTEIDFGGIFVKSEPYKMTGGCSDGTFFYDGRTYGYKKIGTQTWMTENLAYLPGVNKPSEGDKTAPRYYVYGYDGNIPDAAKAIGNYTTYGVLYNWPAAMSACPGGWHLPLDAEWNTLISYLGGESAAGDKMKEAGTAHWKGPNTGANNSSCFLGLPGGVRSLSFGFMSLTELGQFWSATEYTEYEPNVARYRVLTNGNGVIQSHHTYTGMGNSVRCVKD